MPRVKKMLGMALRVAAASTLMVIAYAVSGMIIGGAGVAMTAEETRQAGVALVIVASVCALILSYLILRSPWHGLKLIGAVFLVQFGTETFMTQIETLYFNQALQMDAREFVGIVGAGALRALVFAPLAVAILGKTKGSVHARKKPVAARTAWSKRFATLAPFYVFVYFAFGYFVAWQWEATRLLYAGTTEMKPFFTHFWDLFSTDPLILPFQLMRGALWTALAALIVRMIDARKWEFVLAPALTFALLLALPLGLFPNPYMPAPVRQAHFYELLSSMLLFGGVAGWLLRRAWEPGDARAGLAGRDLGVEPLAHPVRNGRIGAARSGPARRLADGEVSISDSS